MIAGRKSVRGDAEFATRPRVVVAPDAVAVGPDGRPAALDPKPVLLPGACTFRIVTRLRHPSDIGIEKRRPQHGAAASGPGTGAAAEPDASGFRRAHAC